ncbi:MAG: hypothetical protein HYU29_06455 [Chloroflexi bacterium]|nr:hypothetical protein [Chloroflexota bacterium]
MRGKGLGLVVTLLLGVMAGVLVAGAGCRARERAGREPGQFAELVKASFFARTEGGELKAPEGVPDLIVERAGKAVIRLRTAEGYGYLDPLALESELVGEHPKERLLRLERRLGVAMEGGIVSKLADKGAVESLFQRVTFEYLRDKEVTGTVSEVFPDGSLLVIPDEVPEEWKGSTGGMTGATHFHVDARGLVSKTSPLARELEDELLKLPFELQREPPATLARKECQLNQEAMASQVYRELMASVGFSPAKAGGGRETSGSLFDRAWQVFRSGFGRGTSYFGYTGYWLAEQMGSLGFQGLRECDKVTGLQRLGDDLYWTVWRSLEEDRKQRNLVVRTGSRGDEPKVVYAAPGLMLMALPTRHEGTPTMLLSTEGWKDPNSDAPVDPRWQSVYMVRLDEPGSFELVQFPLPPYRGQGEPGPGKLYGHSAVITGDGRYLYAILYGFEGEGGGLWVADLSQEGFPRSEEAFAKILTWDHALSWMVLSPVGDRFSGAPVSVFLTGKEVAQGTAMTANLVRVQLKGLESRVLSKERLLRMVGWNPVPFGIQRVSSREERVLVETHYNYENSLTDRAKGVFIVTVRE